MKDLWKYSAGCLLLLALAAFFAGCNKDSRSRLKTQQGAALGTSYTIKYEAVKDAPDIKTGIDAIFKDINRSMSTYLPDSDITKSNRGDTAVIADHYFKDVFLKAKEVWKNSNGMFDPTVGSLVNAWGFGPEHPLKNVAQHQVDSLLELTGFDKVSLAGNGKLVKAHPNIYLDFNALAKGYTIDCIGRLFDEKGIENYLIEIGGEILTKGHNTQTNKDWTVAIDSPLQQGDERSFMTRIRLPDKAIATSGNYRKFRTDSATGRRYTHIINPKTGYPQQSNVLSVSVIAGNCMEADAYATAFMVMEPEETKALLQRFNTLEAYIIYTGKDGGLTTYTTKGFEALLLNE